MIAGSKFEHNYFTGFEYQPSVRLLYTPTERQTAWAAVSRAVRTPSRVEHDLLFHRLESPTGPVLSRVSGNDNVESEDLLAVEIGYRAQPVREFSWTSPSSGTTTPIWPLRDFLQQHSLIPRFRQ